MLRKEQIAQAFRLEAETDLAMAELAYENGIYSRCVAMSQQVVEKMLKAALAMVGFFGLKKHEMVDHFAVEYNKILTKEFINKIADLAHPIEDEWVRSRYPDWADETQPVCAPSEQYSKDDAEEALSGAKAVYKLIIETMKSKFGFEPQSNSETRE